MKNIFLLGFSLATFYFGTAQDTAGEKKSIQAQIDAFFTSWNKHDFSDMKNYVADTSDFVNIAGFHWKGRDDIQYAHQAIHQELFKDKPLRKISSQIRFLTNDVAIAHVVMHLVGKITTPDGSKVGDNDALATFVLLKKNSAWLITAVENVEVSEVAKSFNPITVRNKKLN
jgi:uncharacterized protein (TIGR02246 family)